MPKKKETVTIPKEQLETILTEIQNLRKEVTDLSKLKEEQLSTPPTSSPVYHSKQIHIPTEAERNMELRTKLEDKLEEASKYVIASGPAKRR